MAWFSRPDKIIHAFVTNNFFLFRRHYNVMFDFFNSKENWFVTMGYLIMLYIDSLLKLRKCVKTPASHDFCHLLSHMLMCLYR